MSRIFVLTRAITAALPVVVSLSAAGAQQRSRNAIVAELDSIANSPIPENRAAGIGVAVVKGTDTLLFKGYGKAVVEWDIPLAADAMFEIGSVTKQFTAAAILQLRDEGKLSLDDEITKYLPDFPTRGHKVTLRRLLDHTSGIVGLTEIPEFGRLSITPWPRDSAYELIKRQQFQFAPGEAQIYNNSAFWLLGLIIEKTSGMTYEDYVEKKIFAPLGMTRSSYCDSHEIVERRAFGYGYRQGELQRAPMNVHTWPFSAGSLCSTPGDMITWLQALHGGKVLSPRSYAEMITPATLNDGTPLRYGMGIGVGEDVRGVRFIGHGGAIAGYVAETMWYPDAQLAVVVLINSVGGVSASALAGELAAVLVPGKPPETKTFTGDVAPFLGTYKGPSRGRDMTIQVTRAAPGIAISINGSPARPVSWVADATFRTGGTFLRFRRTGGDGPFSELRYEGGSALYVLKRQ